MNGWWTSVHDQTVARPDRSRGASALEPHRRQRGAGGWTSRPQPSQPSTRRTPSAPACQKNAVSGARRGTDLESLPDPGTSSKIVESDRYCLRCAAMALVCDGIRVLEVA